MSELSAVLSDQLRIISFFGDSIFLVFAAYFVFSWLLLKKRHLRTLVVFLTTSLSYPYSIFLKYLFRHPRPVTADGLYYFFDLYGFPSSHTVFYTVFWGFIIYLTFKYVREAKLVLHIIRWIAIYFVISVSFSRVILGMHFVKDVVAGYFFGGIFLIFLILLDRKITEIFSKD